MRPRYTLAPQAARDLAQIWRYLKKETGRETADRIEAVIRSKVALLAQAPGIGHWRRDITAADVRFFAVYSYLIVYRPDTKPLQVVSILHARRDVERVLAKRL